MPSKSITSLRKAGYFVAFCKAPKTGDRGKDRAVLMNEMQKRIEDYLEGKKTPRPVNFPGPEHY